METDVSGRHATHRGVILVLAAVCCAGLFVAMRLPTAVNDHRFFVDVFCGEMPASARASCEQGINSLSSNLFAYGLFALLGYVALALPGIALAVSGRRRVFWLPAAVAWALLAVGAGPFFARLYSFGVAMNFAAEAHRHPTVHWMLPPWDTHPVLGALMGLALVLAPAAFAARGQASAPTLGHSQPSRAVAMLACAGAAALLMLAAHPWTTQRAFEPQWWVPWFAVAGYAFVVGLMLGSTRPWWPWLHVVVPLLMTGWVQVQALLLITHQMIPGPSMIWDLKRTVPFVAVCLIGAAYRTMVHRLESLQALRPTAAQSAA